MIQIDDALVGLDVIERCFICDISQCKGACCIEGDSGAPLEEEELEELRKVLPEVWDDLLPEAQEIINQQGVAYIDSDGDIVTSIVNGKNCVFTCYDSEGVCKCAIEKAYREGRVSFYKPVSCHLYPIRITQYRDYRAVNYDRWKICRCAELLGQKAGVPVYQFLKEPLIRKFGEAWYNELEQCADEWRKQQRSYDF
ncbi:MAG: DUF3109 family protein [Tannerellaceae bacterium]|nr:DUF3109 family protein [Tannerellaceae bacterium]